MATVSRLSALISGAQRNVNLAASGAGIQVDILEVGATAPNTLTKTILGNLISLQNATDFSDGTNSHTHDGRYYTETEIGAVADGAAGADLVGVTGIAGILAGADTTVQAALEAFKTYIDDSISGKDDASEITYTAIQPLDWDGDVQPGNVNAALDQLAERVDDNEYDIGTKAADADVLKKDGSVELSSDWDVGGVNKITGIINPTVDSDAANKAYVDATVISQGQVKEAILVVEQISDAQGILAALAAWVATNPAVSDTFILEDGTNTETYTFKAAESAAFDVEIGATAADTMVNLVNAINADSSFWGAKFNADALDSMNADGVAVIYELTSASGASTSRAYGSIAADQAYVQIVEYNGESEYRSAKASIDLPSADPAAGRFGLRRQASALVNGEIHLSLGDDSLYEWDDDGSTWVTLAAGAVPEATSASGGGVKGKWTADSDKGLLISSGVGEVKIDDSTINFSSGSLQIKDLGITNAKVSASAAIVESKLSLDYSTSGLNTAITNHTGSSSNPHSVTFTQAVTADGNTDISAAEAETLTDGSNADSLHQHGITKKTMVAGESFAANTTFAVRMSINGETDGRVYKADQDVSATDTAYVIGLVRPSGAVAAGESIDVILLGEIVSSVAFTASQDEGKPVFLGSSGVLTLTPPDPEATSDKATVRVGTVALTGAASTAKIMVQGIQMVGIT